MVDELILIHLLASCHRDKMSFLNITDPKKRDAIVKEYLDTIKRIKNRNLLEKTHDFVHREMLEETLRTVVSSTAASTEAITNQLVPIKEGITALNANFKHTAAKEEDRRRRRRRRKQRRRRKRRRRRRRRRKG